MLFQFDASQQNHIVVNLDGFSGMCEVTVTNKCDARQFSVNMPYAEYDLLVDFLKQRAHDYAFDEAYERFAL